MNGLRLSMDWLRSCMLREKLYDGDIAAGSPSGEFDVGDQKPWPTDQAQLLRRVLDTVVTNQFVRENWGPRGLDDDPMDEATLSGVLLVLRKGIRSLVPQESHHCTACKETYPEYLMAQKDLCRYCNTPIP